MSGLRLEIDLDKIGENTQCVVDWAAARGISITGVTSAMLGDVHLAHALTSAGVVALGDSRIENIERMRHAHVSTPMLLTRLPMLSHTDRIVRSNTMSVNTDADVLTSLATAARVCGRVHDVMIMVDLGDGVMPAELHTIVGHVLRHPTLRLRGIGTNFGRRDGIEPSDEHVVGLSHLVDDIEATFGVSIDIVSGGDCIDLDGMTGTSGLGRINDLRLGESMLLGRSPFDRAPIAGLHTDALTLVGEVIESRRVPARRLGRSGPHGPGSSVNAQHSDRRGDTWQTVVAVGRQDVDPDDLTGPDGTSILGADSDHLILRAAAPIAVGDDVHFEPGYSALVRAMTSPYVAKHVHEQQRRRSTVAVSSTPPSRTRARPHNDRRRPQLTLVPRLIGDDDADSSGAEPPGRIRPT